MLIIIFYNPNDNTIAQLNDVFKQKVLKGMSILIKPRLSEQELVSKMDKETYEITITAFLNVHYFCSNMTCSTLIFPNFDNFSIAVN